MILEQAQLDVIAGRVGHRHLRAVRTHVHVTKALARSIIESVPGFLGLRLLRGIESPSRYLLLVEWETLESHTIGFRESDGYQQWRRLLHHFYDPFPMVQHFA
jgi:heme-degrading monooxygenase HmoA